MTQDGTGRPAATDTAMDITPKPGGAERGAARPVPAPEPEADAPAPEPTRTAMDITPAP